MSDQISTPLACRVGLAGVVLPYRAFKLRNELPDLVHGSCRAGYEMVGSLSGCELLEVGGRQSSFRNSPDALLVASKRPERQAAVFDHRVPARLNAADVRFIFIDVKRNGHCVARSLAVKALWLIGLQFWPRSI